MAEGCRRRGERAYATPVALCVASWAPQEHSFFLINSAPSISAHVHVYFPQRKTQVLQALRWPHKKKGEEMTRVLYFFIMGFERSNNDKRNIVFFGAAELKRMSMSNKMHDHDQCSRALHEQ